MPVQSGSRQQPRGRYSVRPKKVGVQTISGVYELVVKEQGRPTASLMTVGEVALPLVAQALAGWLPGAAELEPALRAALEVLDGESGEVEYRDGLYALCEVVARVLGVRSPAQLGPPRPREELEPEEELASVTALGARGQAGGDAE